MSLRLRGCEGLCKKLEKPESDIGSIYVAVMIVRHMVSMVSMLPSINIIFYMHLYQILGKCNKVVHNYFKLNN